MTAPSNASTPRRTVALDGASLTIAQVCEVARDGAHAEITSEALARMRRSRAVVDGILSRGDVVYGVNTGFGKLSDVAIPAERLAELAGVRLGKVTAIRETPAGESSQPRYNPYYGYMMTSSPDGSEKQYVSNGLTEITVSVVLHVEFAIE